MDCLVFELRQMLRIPIGRELNEVTAWPRKRLLISGGLRQCFGKVKIQNLNNRFRESAPTHSFPYLPHLDQTNALSALAFAAIENEFVCSKKIIKKKILCKWFSRGYYQCCRGGFDFSPLRNSQNSPCFQLTNERTSLLQIARLLPPPRMRKSRISRIQGISRIHRLLAWLDTTANSRVQLQTFWTRDKNFGQSRARTPELCYSFTIFRSRNSKWNELLMLIMVCGK